MKNLNPLRSVSSITAGLAKMVNQLNDHAEDMATKADRLGVKIDDLATKRYAAIDEGTKAKAIAAKVSNLLEV